MRKSFFPIVFSFLLIVILFDRQTVYADCRFFLDQIENGAVAVAEQDGGILLSCNENTPFIPASIIKIPLALAAFYILGQDYHFTTEFFLDGQDNLYIRGHGDPFLVSEEIDLILDRLLERGMQRINGIFIDNSYAGAVTPVPGQGDSDNPYDVPVTFLGVNFNTVYIHVLSNGSIESAEPQTPTLPIMQDLGKYRQPGIYRLGICMKDCSPVEQSNRYAVELFRALQRNKGIPGDGLTGERKVPAKKIIHYVHENSRNLQDVVFSFLKYSNNFIANQVFLRCGIKKYGLPATWEKGSRAVLEALSHIVGPKVVRDIMMVDGAGLSRSNSITATAMLRILEKFIPYATLLQKKNDFLIKSGTLDGVYNYAGFLNDNKPFVIMLNQKANNRDALLKRLKKNFSKEKSVVRP